MGVTEPGWRWSRASPSPAMALGDAFAAGGAAWLSPSPTHGPAASPQGCSRAAAAGELHRG